MSIDDHFALLIDLVKANNMAEAYWEAQDIADRIRTDGETPIQNSKDYVLGYCDDIINTQAPTQKM